MKRRAERAPWGRRSAVAALVIGAVALAACGESSEDKAKAEVCEARKTISAEVAKLQAIVPSEGALGEAKKGFESIGEQLKKIRDAQPDLEPARKEQVEAATNKFGEQLKTVGAQVVSDLSSGTSEAARETAKPKLKSALDTLAAEYRQALGPVSC